MVNPNRPQIESEPGPEPDVEGHSVEEETGDADANHFNVGCCC